MITEQDITGTWVLVARGNDNPEDARVSIERYGSDPKGMVIISGDPAWHTDAPDADRLAAFDTYISYGGRWRLEGDTFITQVEFALNPGWVGGEQIRGVELTPDGRMKLLLSREWPDGTVVNAWVQWRRV